MHAKRRWPRKCLRNYRAENLRQRYGLSVERYDEMLAEQNFGCGICGRQCDSGRRLAVDHDHSTNKVRGLLCSNCNITLGKMSDQQEWLRNAADYLDAFTFH